VVVEQVRAVVDDISVDAVKIGMLGNVATIEAVAEALDLLAPGTPVVLDPVMVAESGAELLDPSARDALVERLLPRATVVTPNVPEARRLAKATPADSEAPLANPEVPPADDVEALARAVHALGPRYVVVTGGHRDDATDLFFDGATATPIPGERFPGTAAHGSGCTHSSALAAHLALGHEPLEAARRAKAIAAAAVRDGLDDVGAGAGPVDVLGLRPR
jgi:hydroxymethylpyrimidine/phosphomethylpyrimidine kinase